MVDIHSHILPSVDDGAKSWEIAVAMCQMAAADGITHIVATPHANDKFTYNRQSHKAALAKLREHVTGIIEISLGCDFHLTFDNIVALWANPGDYCIDHTKYLLVEFSDFGVSRHLLHTFHELLDRGLTPVITHPERNGMLREDPGLVLEMVQLGCIVQVTASSFTGFWGKRAQKTAEWLLKQGAVHVLATDAHDLKRRTPILSGGRKAVAALAGEVMAEKLVRRNPECIVRGEPLT